MRIYGVGTDIIEVQRVKKAIQRCTLFVSRVYTLHEIGYCRNKGQVQYHSFAARFAAKEAVAKSLGTGFGKKLSLKDIEIVSSGAQPRVRMAGKGLKLMESLGISRIALSISSTKNYAVAYAVSIIE